MKQLSRSINVAHVKILKLLKVLDMVRQIFFLILSMLIGWDQSAYAANKNGSNLTYFRMGGIDFAVPIPAGYCMPQGRDIDIAQALAAADNVNLTHVTLMKCGETDLLNYYILKTPRGAILKDLQLESFLNEIGVQFQSTAIQDFMKDGSLEKEVKKGLQTVLGGDLDLTTDIKPLGRDERCAYVGGTAEFTNVPDPYKISMGGCITIISNRIISVYSYGSRIDAQGVVEQLKKAKELSVRMTGEPAM